MEDGDFRIRKKPQPNHPGPELVKRVMKKAFSILALLLLCIPHTVHAYQETITLVADEWCPYNCAPNSEKPGYMVEIATAAFARHGIAVKYITLPWARAIEDTRTNKYTAIIGAYYNDAPDFIYPETPQGLCRFSFYVKKDDPWQFSDIASLKNRMLGAINDYSYSVALDDYITSQDTQSGRVQILSGENAIQNNIRKLLAGRIDTYVEDRQVMAYTMSDGSYDNVRDMLRDAGTLPDQDDGNGVIFIAFSPQNPKSADYARILSDETKAMARSGEIKAILEKYGIDDFTGGKSR